MVELLVLKVALLVATIICGSNMGASADAIINAEEEGAITSTSNGLPLGPHHPLLVVSPKVVHVLKETCEEL